MLGNVLLFSGLDYVSHEDVLPYRTTEKQPIHNHLFDKFLVTDTETGKSTFILESGICCYCLIMMGFT